MKDLYYRLTWALQRAYRGYDDTATWQLDDYFIAVIPAIKILCKNQIKELPWEGNNERLDIMLDTLRLIEAYEEVEPYSIQSPEVLYKLFEYVGRNLGWYWT